jgi:preprotein translocase subunit SecE
MFNYLKETKAEMKHVTWPTTRQAVIYTILVIGVTIVIAAFLGYFDHLFSTLIQNII